MIVIVVMKEVGAEKEIVVAVSFALIIVITVATFIATLLTPFRYSYLPFLSLLLPFLPLSLSLSSLLVSLLWGEAITRPVTRQDNQGRIERSVLPSK